MRFGVLGAVEVRTAGGQLVTVGGPRVRALLAMLLLDAGRTVGVERLVDGLYGAELPGDPEHALQGQVSRLRQALVSDELVTFEPGGYRLVVDPEDVDVHRFERLVAEGRRAVDDAETAKLLRSALDLWRGPALADVLRVPFAAAQAFRLSEARVDAFEDCVEAELALGEFRSLAVELPEMIATHPLRERLRGQLMRALAGSGRRAEALEIFEVTRRILADELGTDPSPELQSVHVAVLRADSMVTPRLPAQFTSFVGRDADLDRLDALLKKRRLVTLTGPGGVGKTRLAIEAAARMDDDVGFVDLASVADAAPALVAALGLRGAGLFPPPSGRPDPASRLVASLADRRMLLVLDNCEHLIEEVAPLVQRLLTECAGLRVLVTSREPLGVIGETLHPVAPLGSAAVELFVDRAVAVRPDFTSDGVVVAHICQALDGLPLAVELAAARLSSLTVEQLAARLADRFGLLSRRSASPRHRTLRDVVGWSWDLLTRDEQAIAARLTVFAGGATLEAVEAVCGMPDAVELLAGLTDKSLVEFDGCRYRMLETVREFCGERLTTDLRSAHAGYFLSLAQQVEPHLRGPDQLEWLARLDAEHGNLQAALRWSVRGDPVLGLRLLGVLAWHGHLRGLTAERAPLAARLLERASSEGLDEDYALCAGDATAALTIERVRLPYLSVMAFMTLGPKALERIVFPGDPWSLAFGKVCEGIRQTYAGVPAEAESAFADALRRYRSIGDRWGIATALDQLAGLAEGSEFLALIDEAIGLVRELDAAEDMTRLLVRKGDGLTTAGDLDDAQVEYERAAEFARRSGLLEVRAGPWRGLAEIAQRRGDSPLARDLYERALRACDADTASADVMRWQVRIGLGRLAVCDGDPDSARTHFQLALDIAEHQDHRPAVTQSRALLTSLDPTT